MPRKVFITKDTLEEILAKYQGGGSGTSDGTLRAMFSFEGQNLEVYKYVNIYLDKRAYQALEQQAGVSIEQLKSMWSSLPISNKAQAFVGAISFGYQKNINSGDGIDYQLPMVDANYDGHNTFTFYYFTDGQLTNFTLTTTDLNESTFDFVLF